VNLAQACPSEAELLSFADVDLTPEQLQRVERHVTNCARCTLEIAAIKQLDR
jgi:anti-sigma factor RsiW